MRRSLKWSLVALGLLVPLSAQAHRAWLLPSATVLSGPNVWVTVDAAVSNSLFVFEHFPLRLANVGPAPESVGDRGRGADLVITAPDGSQLEAQNGAIGRYRSTFDIELKQAGTYRISADYDGQVGPQTVIAVGQGFMGQLFATVFLGLGAVFLGMILTVATVVGVYLARRRARQA